MELFGVFPRPRYSKYPPTSLKVVSYAQPKVFGGEEGEERTPKTKKRKMSKSCPTSPHPLSSTFSDFSSQPASPISHFPSFLMDMEEDEEKNIGRKMKKQRKNKEDIFGESFEKTETKKNLKMSKRRLMKERKRALIGKKLEEGKTRAEVLEDVMDNKKRRNAQETKKLKHLIRDCDQKKKAKRLAEFQEKRGFKSNNIEQQGMMRRDEI